MVLTLKFKNNAVLCLNFFKNSGVKPRPFLKVTSLQGARATVQDLDTNFGPRKAELNFLFHNASPMCRQGSREAPLTHPLSVYKTTWAVLSQPSDMGTVKTGRENEGKYLGDRVNPFTILSQITMSFQNHSCSCLC